MNDRPAPSERANRRRVVLTFADQGVSSASNFIVGVLVARSGGVSELGSYMIAFLVWLAVVGIHRALITEPMIVDGIPDDVRTERLRRGARAELVLGVALGGAVALAGAGAVVYGSDIGRALLALAPWLPALLVQDYWRAMAFRERRPEIALLNDSIFAAVQLAAIAVIVALDVRTVVGYVGAWGIGASAGALVGIRWAGVGIRGSGGLAHLRDLWPRSRWFVAEFGTGFASDQGYLALLPVLVGTIEYGGFRAAYSLLGPVMVILLAGGNLGLPESSAAYHEGGRAALARYAPRLTAGVAGVVALYCALVAIFAEPLLRAAYGSDFAPYAEIARLGALQYAVATTGFGFGIAVKVLGHLRALWVARLGVAAVSLVAVVVLVESLGTVGAGWAGVLTGISYTVGVQLAYRFSVRRPANTPSRADLAVGEAGPVPGFDPSNPPAEVVLAPVPAPETSERSKGATQ